MPRPQPGYDKYIARLRAGVRTTDELGTRTFQTIVKQPSACYQVFVKAIPVRSVGRSYPFVIPLKPNRQVGLVPSPCGIDERRCHMYRR
jgi:hypothetical protein